MTLFEIYLNKHDVHILTVKNFKLSFISSTDIFEMLIF